MKTTVQKLIAENSPASERLKKQIRILEGERKKLIDQLADREEFASACSAAVTAMDPYPKFKYAQPSKLAIPITAVIVFSDWHIGEYIDSRQTEGFGKYNWDIAQKRALSITQDFIKFTDVQRTAYNIQECRVFSLGDLISGDIHRELSVTNEFPIPEQAVKAGTLLGECIRRLSAHYNRVVVDAVGADNHGRLNPKPQAKQKTNNNMSFISHEIAKVATSACPNVSWNIAEGAKQLAIVNSRRFLLEHGDNIKGSMGFPYYGFGRLIGREATRRMGTNKYFDMLCIGHWHVPALIEGRTLVNGSLSGTSEYDSGCGRHAPPAQIAFLVHPEHGIFNFTAFNC